MMFTKSRQAFRLVLLCPLMVGIASSCHANTLHSTSSIEHPSLTQLSAAKSQTHRIERRTLTVTATAYTSHEAQTDSTPNIAAWGDKLKPGMKAIAVSRDLLDMGLTRGVEVKIDGIPQSFTVLDKMNKRWTKKIDIYMGKDIDAALEWGKRKVTISWPVLTTAAQSAPSAPKTTDDAPAVILANNDERSPD